MPNFALLYFKFLNILLLLTSIPSTLSKSCEHTIFCNGPLLHTIQMSRVFSDSKTFVDMALAYDEEIVAENYKLLMLRTRHSPSLQDIRDFIVANFKESFHELEPWFPPDYQPSPPLLSRIKHPNIKKFTKFLIDIWPTLGRRVKGDVYQEIDRHSLIPVPNGFIIPGGRFREFYYWDSYWILRGLLICNMKNTARGMLENLFHIVKLHGFIPNGGRIYYLDRTQPPVLCMMAMSYLEVSKDSIFIKKNILFLEQELLFWLNNRMVTVRRAGKSYEMAHYQSDSDLPRPESYYEDIHTASAFKAEKQRRQLYQNLRSGAESGWDFSSRWIFLNNEVSDNLAYIDPLRVIPVDLNAFLCRSFKIMSELFARFWYGPKAEFWRGKHEEMQRAIEEVLYDAEDGTWYDYDIGTETPRKQFYPSNLTPLFTFSYNSSQKNELGAKSAAYLVRNGITNYPGGLPASLRQSGQQWDFPNAWAPSQTMVIFGLEHTGNEEAIRVARIFAKSWLQCVEKVATQTREMFEKYNAAFLGMFGHGGEYEVQTGFGWTNGVVLELIEYYFVKKDIDLGWELQ